MSGKALPFRPLPHYIVSGSAAMGGSASFSHPEPLRKGGVFPLIGGQSPASILYLILQSSLSRRRFSSMSAQSDLYRYFDCILLELFRYARFLKYMNKSMWLVFLICALRHSSCSLNRQSSARNNSRHRHRCNRSPGETGYDGCDR